MKTIKITATFPTLAAAVDASGIDLSYNPQAAAESIALIDNPPRRWREQGTKGCSEAYLLADGRIAYRYSCDLTLINIWTPFVSTLSDGCFYPVSIVNNAFNVYTELPLPKSNRRNLVKNCQGMAFTADL